MKLPQKSVLQAIALAWAILLVPAAALADGFLDDDLWYRFESGSETQVYVGGLRNASAIHITIPSTVVYEYTDGKDEDGHHIVKHRTCRVTSIASSAFKSCTSLTSVTIGNAVTSIGYEAFYNCSGLASVTIGNGVTSIAGGAFHNCSGLASVTIGNSVTSIGGSAFSGCSALTSVTIPNSVTSIGDYAFHNCSGLASVTIGNSVTSIGENAFRKCKGLMSVTIPDSVRSIERNVFEGCSGLTSVTIPDSVTSIGEESFIGCSSLSSLTIPDSVTNIGKKAFTGCNSLTSVTILGNVTNDWAYYSNPFFGCNIATLVLGGKMTKIGSSLFFCCNGLASVTIPDCVTSIGDFGFSECYSLASVTIGNGVTNIGEAAFRYCTNLTSVAIGNAVTSIGDGAFYSCYALASVAIPDSVKSIGGGAFADCNGLTSVMIPDSVTHIGGSAFCWCTNLASVTIGNAVTEIGDRSFEGCSGLTSVTIPGSVKDIGCSAFGRSGLASVTFEGAPPHVDEEYPPFSDVAPDARGYYTAAHAAKWEKVIVDGKWQGLIMEMLGGMSEPPVLQVQSANPAEGSLTLAWEDPCVTDDVTYSVYRSANDTYSATDLVTNGLTEMSWTDTNYWSAEPVLKPLNYWVVADGGGYGERESNRKETRHRLGICVGYDAYGVNSNPVAQALADAKLCNELAQKAGFAMKPLLANSDATAERIHGALVELAQEAKAGDTVLFFIATHGKVNRAQDYAALQAYDRDFTALRLAKDVEAFKFGVGFLGVIMACYSRAVADGSELTGEAYNWLQENGLDACNLHAAWITSSETRERSYAKLDVKQTVFGEWFLHQGWQNGFADKHLTGVDYAGGNEDGTNTVLELARYSAAFARGLSDEKSSHVFYDNAALLGKIIIANDILPSAMQPPDIPDNVNASQGLFDSKIDVSWPVVNNALWYWIYVLKDGRTGDLDEDWSCLSYVQNKPNYQHKSSLLGKNYRYRVRAVNAVGASDFSVMSLGIRGTGTMLAWIVEKGKSLGHFGNATELAGKASANGTSLEACYVIGLDPTDPNAAFLAELTYENGKWKATPVGGEKEGRVYYVEGKKEMSDEDWTDVTDVEDLDAEGWRFFRVGVELAE